MHFPINLHLGNVVVPAHLICETLAYFIGFRYYVFLRARTCDAINPQQRLIIFVGAAAGAFIGSHTLGVLENPVLLRHLSLVYFLTNKTIVGGFLGGLIGVEWVKKLIGVEVSSGDLMVYPLIVAMIIGRTGCFLAGLTDGTFGIPSNLPWAINFGDNIYRHPTNLYEMLFWLLLWCMLRLTELKYTFTNGSRFKVFMVSYLIFRFFIEFIKPAYFFSFGLSVIQLACLAGLLYYYKVFRYPLSLIQRHA